MFYYNVTTGESVWEIPKQEEGFVDERRMSLFPYQMSGQRDDLESKLPDGWTIHETNDGKFFYFNQQTKQVRAGPKEASPLNTPPELLGFLDTSHGERRRCTLHDDGHDHQHHHHQ